MAAQMGGSGHGTGSHSRGGGYTAAGGGGYTFAGGGGGTYVVKWYLKET